MNAQPDRRLHAYRPDLAEEALRGSVTAGHYVTGMPARLSASLASLRPRPDETAGIDTQVLFGEGVRVLDRADGWAWVKSDFDGYVGYLPETALDAAGAAPTHVVAVPRTSLFLAMSCNSTPSSGPALSSERAKTLRPSVPA